MNPPMLIFTLFLMATAANASDDNTVSSLTPDLQLLFSQEMLHLRKGMNQIMEAYITGQWRDIAITAKQMENSYVLRQGLSQEQLHELHSKLPKAFLQMDEQFHYYAGMLAHVAENNKAELIGFYISKMSETCVNCHRSYATETFPGFRHDADSQSATDNGGHIHAPQ